MSKLVEVSKGFFARLPEESEKESNNIELDLELINITSIKGDNIKRLGEKLTSLSCYELEDVVISGTVNVGDRYIEVPIMRDDGRLFFFEGEIKGGVFTVSLNFPTGGFFIYSNHQANYKSGSTHFNVETLSITVMRKPTTI